MPANFWEMQFKDYLTLFVLAATIWAIYYGPIKAVEVSRKNQDEDAKRARQYGILHNLMKTRKFQLAPDHVSALNLVQLEFYGNARVQELYKTYMGLLNGAWPNTDDADNWKRHAEEREAALFDLIHQIGLALGYTIDRQELKRLGYGPQGWQTDEEQGAALRQLLIATLEGKRGLPVCDFDKMHKFVGKFPPPPT